MIQCKCDVKKCHAGCCGLVPIPMETYMKYREKAPRKEAITEPFFDGNIVAVDADGVCVFLTNDYSCSIYDERPEVCRKFGEDNHPLLQCPHLKKNKK